MISLQLPSQHVSSYATSITHPAVQSSYDYASSVCNPQTWASGAPYPSPPMSSSPTATTHYANHAERAFDPNYTRMRSQPTMGPEFQFWPQGAYQQHVYPQHPQPASQQMTTLPLHQGRSPRMQHAVAAPYLPPPTAHVPQPYPTFAQSQQARDYVPQQGTYSSVQTQSGPSSLAMVSAGSKVANKPVRRTKQHVQTACFNCKKAHLSCDVGRPCNRCKQSGKQETCYNVAHKRRGRPRLRDTFGNKIVRHPEPQATGAAVAGATISTAPVPRRRSDPSLRVLKSQGDTRQAAPSAVHGQSDNFMASNMTGNLGFARPLAATSPVAFLDLDLTVVRTNTFFNNLFGLEPDSRARILDNFIEANDVARLQNIRNKLREEKDARDPAYLAPLRMNGTRDADSIPMVDMGDLSDIISQGFQEMNAELRMRLAGGVIHSIRINIRLAKTEVFFAVLVLPPISEIIPSYPQQQARPMPSPGPSYTFGSNYPPHGYGVSDVSVLASRRSVSTSAPASPYYTYAPTSMPSASSSRLSSAQTSYDSGTGMYFPQNMQTTAMYGYTAQNGVPSPAMTGGTQPRQFQGYAQEPQQLQMQFQTPSQQHLLQSTYQLPPITAQGERPSSAAPVPSSMGTMRTDAYGREHQQAYMNLRDDGQPHVDGSHLTSNSADRGRGPHLTNLLQ